STPSLSDSSSTPVAATRAHSAGNASSARGPRNNVSNRAPRSRTASIARAPSTTNAPSVTRALASRNNSRSRFTALCRGPNEAASCAVTGCSGSFERLARGGDQRAEGSRVAHRKVGEDLAVDLDLRRLQPGDEARVRDVVLATRGVDAHDPEPAELTL